MKFLRYVLVGTVLSVLGACGGGDEINFLNDAAATPTTVTDDVIDIATSDQVGIGSGASFQAGVAGAELVSAGASSASWEISVVVADPDNLAVTDEVTVTFTSSCVTAGLASFDNSTVTTLAGRASTTYSSGSCSGTDTIVASIPSGASASVDLNIDAIVDDNDNVGVVDEVFQIGNGFDADFEDGVLTAVPLTLNAGGSTTVTASLVGADSAAFVQPVTVNFSSPCVSSGLASFESATVASVAGSAVVNYTASGCVGDDLITATATSNGEAVTATVTINVLSDQVSGIEFVSSVPTAISLPGSGGTELATVSFRVIGQLGEPIAGELVTFELTQEAGGVSILGDPQNPGTPSATSDANGIVSAVVQSGTVSSIVGVVATHVATGNQANSADIVISSGVAIQSAFSLSQGSFIPADAFNTDNVEVPFTIIASDVFGNNVADGSQVFFASPESGNIDSSCQIVDGTCSVVWRSAGQRPADNRVTIIAYTDGAEDFTDINGNFVFENGIDVLPAEDDIATEPFVDENESGEHELGEFFVDADLNGEFRSVGNGEWDGPCLLLFEGETPDALNARCPGEDSILIFDTALLRLPTNNPEVNAFFVDGAAADISQTVSAGGDGAVTLLVEVGDDNNNIDPDIADAHPLPPDTTFSWSIETGIVQLVNAPQVSVEDEGDQGLTMTTATVIGTFPAIVSLTITVPGRDSVEIPVFIDP